MFSRTSTIQSTAACSKSLERVLESLSQADAVVIGAGAGLSASAGFTYSGERFRSSFADFEAKYGFHDMYFGGFYPYKTPEEYWAYWSRYVYVNRYMDAPKPVYGTLLRLIKDKDYFVLTTNVDHCFQKAGFDKKRLFYTQGDYGLFQCAEPCCAETFDNRGAILKMLEQQRDMRIPSALLPVCPHCRKPLTMNLRADQAFVEDAGWRRASERYAAFLRSRRSQRILFLELGVGYNTPGIIKYPFWQMTAANPQAVYVSVNNGEAVCPQEISRQAVCINGDIGDVLHALETLEKKAQ